jgi:predicted RNA-binding Zn-ribbon protein involved in translation (DUF1610 family)
MTTSRLEVVDEHGVRHRYGCHAPGWTSEPSRVAGYYILRCPTCGAVRIVRTQVTR